MYNTLKPALLTARSRPAGAEAQAELHEQTASVEPEPFQASEAGLVLARTRPKIPTQQERLAQKHRKANALFWAVWNKVNPDVSVRVAHDAGGELLEPNARWPFIRYDPGDLLSVLEADPTQLQYAFAVRVGEDRYDRSWNPYELSLVGTEEAKARERYYTVSSSGVTEFFHGRPREHNSLKAYTKEYELFRALAAFPVFATVRRCRFWFFWRRFVAARRQARAARALTQDGALLAAEKMSHLRPLLAFLANCAARVEAMRLAPAAPDRGSEAPPLPDWAEWAGMQIAVHGAGLQALAREQVSYLAALVQRRMDDAHARARAADPAAHTTPRHDARPPVAPLSARSAGAKTSPRQPMLGGPVERLAHSFAAAAGGASPGREAGGRRARSETPPREEAAPEAAPSPQHAAVPRLPIPRPPPPSQAPPRRSPRSWRVAAVPRLGDEHISSFLKEKGARDRRADHFLSPRKPPPASPAAPDQPSARRQGPVAALELLSGDRPGDLAALTLAPLPLPPPTAPPAPVRSLRLEAAVGEGRQATARAVHAEVAVARAVCRDSLNVFVKRAQLAWQAATRAAAAALIADLATFLGRPALDPALEPAPAPPAEPPEPVTVEAPPPKKTGKTRKVGRAFIVERAPSPEEEEAPVPAAPPPEGSPPEAPPPAELAPAPPGASQADGASGAHARPAEGGEGSAGETEGEGPQPLVAEGDAAAGGEGENEFLAPPKPKALFRVAAVWDAGRAAVRISPEPSLVVRRIDSLARDALRAAAAAESLASAVALRPFYRLAANDERDALPPFEHILRPDFGPDTDACPRPARPLPDRPAAEPGGAAAGRGGRGAESRRRRSRGARGRRGPGRRAGGAAGGDGPAARGGARGGGAAAGAVRGGAAGAGGGGAVAGGGGGRGGGGGHRRLGGPRARPAASEGRVRPPGRCPRPLQRPHPRSIYARTGGPRLAMHAAEVLVEGPPTASHPPPAPPDQAPARESPETVAP